MNGPLPVAHVHCPCALAWLAQGQGTLQLADPPMDDHERKKTRGRGHKEEGGRTVLYKERKSKQTKIRWEDKEPTRKIVPLLSFMDRKDRTTSLHSLRLVFLLRAIERSISQL